jgi:hypothetical protein
MTWFRDLPGWGQWLVALWAIGAAVLAALYAWELAARRLQRNNWVGHLRVARAVALWPAAMPYYFVRVWADRRREARWERFMAELSAGVENARPIALADKKPEKPGDPGWIESYDEHGRREDPLIELLLNQAAYGEGGAVFANANDDGTVTISRDGTEETIPDPRPDAHSPEERTDP